MADSATPWTVACQAPLSTGFSRQECRSGLPFPSPFFSPLLINSSCRNQVAQARNQGIIFISSFLLTSTPNPSANSVILLQNRTIIKTLLLPLSVLCVLCLVAQLCLTLCSLMDYSPPVFSVHGSLQTRILVWVAMPSSRGYS